MPREIFALPVVSQAAQDLYRCVESYKLYDSEDLQVVHWKCCHDGDALRAERHHTKYVLSIIRAGACCLHDGSWTATCDPTTAVLHRPDNAYRTTHPFGCIDDGWSIAFGEKMAQILLHEAGVDPARWDRPSITVATQPARSALQNLIMIERASFQQPVDTLTVESLCVDAVS